MKPETRTKLAKAVGLTADASDEAILKGIDDVLDKRAEKRVAAAIRTHKILAAHQDYWLNAFKTDHWGTSSVLDSLTPAWSVVSPPQASNGASIAASVPNGYSPPAPIRPPQASNLSEQTISDAQADAELWAMGYRTGIEPPPKPGWWEIFPPKDL